jgi:hypothetical protein
MAHEWHRGVLDTSSWHGLEEVGKMATAEDLIAHGEQSGAWPTALRFEELRTPGGLFVPGRAVVGSFAQHPEASLGIVGGTYNATTPEGWRSLMTAAVAAGAKPTGAFALRGGSRVIATFEVGQSNGLRTSLCIADAFDGSMKFLTGFSSIRWVCANTMSAGLRKDGRGFAGLTHNATLETKVNILAEAIGDAIKSGDKVRDAYHAAEKMKLTAKQADAVFDKLFPPPADILDTDKGATLAVKTRLQNVRAEARKAMARKENAAGRSLATLWNAATWLVDRTAEGTAKETRGESGALDSLLFGTRGNRVADIQTIVEVILRDGTVKSMPATDALEIGVDPKIIGRHVIEDMIAST